MKRFRHILAITPGAKKGGGGKPAAPQNFAATVVDEVSIGLTWDAVTGADSYKIYYGTDGVTFASSTTSATNSKTVEGLTADTTYYFYTVAIKGTTEGNASGVVHNKTYNYFITSVVTTGAETLTLTRIDVKAGESITIDWGDGLDDTYTDAGNGATKTHPYAGAGTWVVKISGARFITSVNLQDAKLRFNSESFLSCGDNLASIDLNDVLTTPVINSADMAHLKLSHQLVFYFTQPGTYNINSADFAAYTLSSTLNLNFPQAGTYSIDSADFTAYTLSSTLYLNFNQPGTYNINSADFAAYTLSSTLFLRFSQAGTYSIDSADFAAYTLSSTFYLSFSQAGTYSIDSADFAAYTLSYMLNLYLTKAGTYTVARTDFSGFVRVSTVIISMNLVSADVDKILLGLYDAFPSKTNTGGTITLTGNQAPAGTYQAKVPPTTGKEAAYELLNDSGGVSTKHWATITVEGGGTP